MTDPSHNAEAAHYRIEQVAARTGLTKRTIRYYEEIGLIAPAARSDGNYRLYSEADVTRLERLYRVKEALGLTLAETIEMVRIEEERDAIRANFQETRDATERLAQLARAEANARQQLALVETKLRTLTETRSTILERLERYARLRAEIVSE
jgi:DNA-binding transcriptional MerR regulator